MTATARSPRDEKRRVCAQAADVSLPVKSGTFSALFSDEPFKPVEATDAN